MRELTTEEKATRDLQRQRLTKFREDLVADIRLQWVTQTFRRRQRTGTLTIAFQRLYKVTRVLKASTLIPRES